MSRALFYRTVRAASIPLFRLYFGLRVEGLGEVPSEGPLLVAANHASYLDPAVLGSGFPRPMHFLINARVWRAKAMNWFYRGMEAIPVDRDGRPTRDAIAAALGRLREGRVVGIFPEGGRAEGGSVEEALAGVSLLARRSGAPVLPVGIAGTGESMPVGKALPEPVPVRVAIGAPMRHDAPEERGPHARREHDRLFTEELMNRIAELAARAESGRRPGAGSLREAS